MREERLPLWPRALGLALAFLVILVAGIVTVLVPELRDDRDDQATPAGTTPAAAPPPAAAPTAGDGAR